MITEILKEMGPETTPKEAELVEMIVKKSEEKVLDTHAAEEISKLANEIGEFMSTTELKKMKVDIDKEKSDLKLKSSLLTIENKFVIDFVAE